MASSFSTWKGQQMGSAREPDPLAELVRTKEDAEGTVAGSLIEGDDSVTLVLIAPGHSRRDLGVWAEQDRLKVEAFDFKVVRMLRCAVDPNTARTTYHDGVLCVRVDKKI